MSIHGASAVFFEKPFDDSYEQTVTDVVCDSSAEPHTDRRGYVRGAAGVNGHELVLR